MRCPTQFPAPVVISASAKPSVGRFVRGFLDFAVAALFQRRAATIASCAWSPAGLRHRSLTVAAAKPVMDPAAGATVFSDVVRCGIVRATIAAEVFAPDVHGDETGDEKGTGQVEQRFLLPLRVALIYIDQSATWTASVACKPLVQVPHLAGVEHAPGALEVPGIGERHQTRWG